MTWLLVIALLIVTLQVIGLRSHLKSPAWNFKAAGFIVIAANVLLGRFADTVVSNDVRRGLFLAGLISLIVGYHLFRRDLKAVGRWGGSKH